MTVDAPYITTQSTKRIIFAVPLSLPFNSYLQINCESPLTRNLLGDDMVTAQNGTISESECPKFCEPLADYYDFIRVFYIRDTQQCYCSDSWWWYDPENDTDCFNVNEFDARKWTYECCIRIMPGRPYNLKGESHLTATVRYIDCSEYTLYDDDEWREFMANGLTNQSDPETASKWIRQGLDEHASIGTFAKFTLELMSIGAPLWMIKLANIAGLDEIRHAQISFDIANGHLNERECVVPGPFPQHQVTVDGDWNRIAMDAVIGGCIGETVAAFKMMESVSGTTLDEFVRQIAMDEIRHAALAWISVKWMIEQRQDIVGGDNMNVGNQEWWKQQIAGRKLSSENVFVYDAVIPTILQMIKSQRNHQELYSEIVDMMTSLMVKGPSPQCAA